MNQAVRYRAWLCDLDGTLYQARGLRMVMALELLCLGLSELNTIREFRHEHERLRKSGAPLMHPEKTPFEQQVAQTAARLGRPEVEVQQVVERWMIQRPARWLKKFRREQLLAEIADFRAAGGATAVVSDYPARVKLEALGLTNSFDVVVASGDPDGPMRLKPEPDGYLKAARKLAMEPADCLVIGDREDTDGAAAGAAGMAFRLIR